MWLYESKEFNEVPDGVIGFVYLITNLTTGKKYVGKKGFFSTRRIKSKKTVRRKVKTSNSDWLDYYGSNDALAADLAVTGAGNYQREILHLCKSKGEMSYMELKEQIDRNVLFRDDYFNSYIGARIHRSHMRGWHGPAKE